MFPKDEEIRNILLSYRDYYGSYHDRKEQMAWVASALYLGMSMLIAEMIADVNNSNGPLWDVAEIIIFLFLMGAFYKIANEFIDSQFKYKWFAARVVEACSTLVFEDLTKKEMSLFHHIDFPRLNMPKMIFEKMPNVQLGGNGQYFVDINNYAGQAETLIKKSMTYISGAVVLLLLVKLILTLLKLCHYCQYLSQCL